MARPIRPTDTAVGVSIGSIRILVTALLLSVAGSLGAQSADDASLVERQVQSWILYRCGTGDEARVAVSLKALGARAEAVLIEAADRGPPSYLMTAFEQQLDESWRARVQQLESEDDTGLEPELIELLVAESKEDFIAYNRREFVLGYRQKAMTGLADVGTARARPILERLERDHTPMIEDAARAALRSIDERLDVSIP